MSRKTHIMVDLIHFNEDMPVRIYSGLDEDRYEVRKIGIFKDGIIGYAYDDVEVGPSGLEELPVLPL